MRFSDLFSMRRARRPRPRPVNPGVEGLAEMLGLSTQETAYYIRRLRLFYPAEEDRQKIFLWAASAPSGAEQRLDRLILRLVKGGDALDMLNMPLPADPDDDGEQGTLPRVTG